MQEIMNDIYKFNFLDNIYVYMNFKMRERILNKILSEFREQRNTLSLDLNQKINKKFSGLVY